MSDDNYLDDDLDKPRGLTYEDVLEILEEELLLAFDNDNENPYRPLNFNDTDEGYEE